VHCKTAYIWFWYLFGILLISLNVMLKILGANISCVGFGQNCFPDYNCKNGKFARHLSLIKQTSFSYFSARIQVSQLRTDSFKNETGVFHSIIWDVTNIWQNDSNCTKMYNMTITDTRNISRSRENARKPHFSWRLSTVCCNAAELCDLVPPLVLTETAKA